MNQITGTDEMMFLDGAAGDAARLSDFAIRAGVLAPGEDPELPAWEERLLQLRRRLRGPGISAVLRCPACDARVALDFCDDDLPRETPGPAASIEGVALRPLRLSDLTAAESSPDPQVRLNLLLARTAGRDQAWAEVVLAGAAREQAILALEHLAAGLDLQIQTACTECDGPIVAPFDVSQFVASELQAGAERLLETVHLIASAYHWSEAEILRLPRERRQAYLARIERDVLRAEVFDDAG